ncbi:MAG: hypothetical protein ACKO8Q_03095 [Bacteroidota bacterium]
MKYLFFIFWISVAFYACTKDPGLGGAGIISGKVNKEVRVVLTNPNTAIYTVPAADHEVYIVYGGHTSPDDKVVTNFNGEFEFRNLRRGNYTIYTYSRDTTGTNPPVVDPSKMVILQEVELVDNHDQVILSDLTVYDTQ